MGIVYIYEYAQPSFLISEVGARLGFSYFTISFALNVLLTLMIIARLVLNSRNLRNAIGASAGTGGLYSAVVTTLVESYGLYAIAFVMFIVPWAAEHPIAKVFSSVLAQTQVRDDAMFSCISQSSYVY
jgi:hypothetical protein